MLRTIFCASILTVSTATSASAGEPPPLDRTPALSNPICSDPSSDGFHRAGHPQCIAPYAKPSDTSRYTGGYVGGGCAFFGRGREVEEGTWGWDYSGGVLRHHPWLNWCRNRRCQGGSGAYRTDGPRVPDPLGHFKF